MSYVNVYNAYNFSGAYGYIINRQAAINILKTQKPLHFEIDVFQYYYMLGLCDLYCLDKDLVFTDNNLESSIEEARGQKIGFDKLREQNFRLLVHKLPFSHYVLFQWRRLQKMFRKPFETFDY